DVLHDRATLRAARRSQLLHLPLSYDGRVPIAVVVEPDHIPDRALLVRDRPLNCFPVSADLQVGLLLRREAAGDLPPFVALAEGDADIPIRPADVGQLHALDVRPRRLAVPGDGDCVEDGARPRPE